MEAMRASSERENILGAVSDHVVSDEHLADEKRAMCVASAVRASLAALRDAIVGILGLNEDAVNALVTSKATMK